MTPGTYDLKLYRGDSYAWRFTLWADDAKTEPVDLTGATVESEIRDRSAGTVIVALGCTIVAPNHIDVALTPAMWVGAPAGGVWDLQVTYPTGAVQTVVTGKVTTTADVTDSTTAVATRLRTA